MKASSCGCVLALVISGGSAFGQRDAKAGIADAPGVEVVLKNASFRDPGTNNIESHRILIPEGWRVGGGVTWTPMVLLAYVHLDAHAAGEDGREVRFHPNGSFTYFETNMAVPRARPGQLANGKTWMKPPRGAEDFVTGSVLKRARPMAKGVRVVDSKNMPGYAATWEKVFEGVLEQQRLQNQFAQQVGLGARVETRIEAPGVRVAYVEDEEKFEEDFIMIYLKTTVVFDNGFGSWVRGADWAVYEVKSMRAPEGELDDSLPLLRTVASSVRPTETWFAMMAQLNGRLADIRRRGHQLTLKLIQDTSRKIAQHGDDIRAMNRDSWEKQQASSARLSRAWSNVMLGVDDYELPDGTTRSLDSSYARVFTNKLDEFVFSNDLDFDPNQHSAQVWSEVKPIRPLGGAADP